MVMISMINTWILFYDNTFDLDDLEYIKKFSSDVYTSSSETITVPLFNKSIMVISKPSEIRITTNCEQQEIMLKLKYGSSLHLIQSTTDIEWN
jgi:hypothetical protein